MSWNFTQNIIFGLPNSGIMVDYSVFTLDSASVKNSFFYDSVFGVEGSVMSILIQLAMCALIYFLSKKH